MTSPALDCKTFPISLSPAERLAFVQLLGTPDRNGQKPRLVVDGPTGKLSRRMTKALGLDAINEAADADPIGVGRLHPQMCMNRTERRTFIVKGDVVGFIVSKVIPLERDEKIERLLGPTFDILGDIIAGNEVALEGNDPAYEDDLERWKLPLPPEPQK